MCTRSVRANWSPCLSRFAKEYTLISSMARLTYFCRRTDFNCQYAFSLA